MSTFDAARSIRDQLRAQGEPAPFHECLRWASDCRKEAVERKEARRQEWFELRRREIQNERWRQRVRNAPVITPMRHDGRNGREGGWCYDYYKPEPKEDAA